MDASQLQANPQLKPSIVMKISSPRIHLYSNFNLMLLYRIMNTDVWVNTHIGL